MAIEWSGTRLSKKLYVHDGVTHLPGVVYGKDEMLWWDVRCHLPISISQNSTIKIPRDGCQDNGLDAHGNERILSNYPIGGGDGGVHSNNEIPSFPNSTRLQQMRRKLNPVPPQWYSISILISMMTPVIGHASTFNTQVNTSTASTSPTTSTASSHSCYHQMASFTSIQITTSSSSPLKPCYMLYKSC